MTTKTAAQARTEVIAQMTQARGDYSEALNRREGILCAENWVVRIGGFYLRLITEGRTILASQPGGLIGCSILTRRDAEAVAMAARNGNGDKGEAVLYVEALRHEITEIDKLIAVIEGAAV